MQVVPKISIIVPCYKQAEYLPEALDSVLAQTESNWECIIVDDGSPDNTAAIAKRYCRNDNRFKYLHKPNGGLSDARNAGIKRAVSPIILPLDADDRILPEYVEQIILRFQEHPQTKIVYCQARKFGAINERWNLSDYSYSSMLQENCIFCSAAFYREDWEIVGGYATCMTWGLEDWEFFLCLLNKDSIVFRIPKILFEYRIKPDSMTTQLRESKKAAMLQIVYSRHQDQIFTGLQNQIFDGLKNTSSNQKLLIVYRITLLGISSLMLRPYFISIWKFHRAFLFKPILYKALLAGIKDRMKVKRISPPYQGL